MTSKSRVKLQTLLAFVGVLALLASVALAAGTMRPTEATWQDTVAGEARFGTAQNAGKNRARATSAYGSMTYRLADQENLAKVEVLSRSESSLPGASTGPITRSVRGALLNVPATVDGTVCARSTKDGVTCSEDPESAATTFAQAKSSNLRISSFGLPIVRYAEGRNASPAIATAACTPGRMGVAGISGGESVVLGRGLNIVDVPMPKANQESREQRTWGLVTYTARLQRTEKVDLGYAKSELRLHVEADGATGEPWILHIVLANAECGVSQAIQEKLDQPTATNFQSLVRSASVMRSAAPASLQPITDLVEDASAEEAGVVKDETGEPADAVADPDETELPSLPSVDETASSGTAATTATTTPSTSQSSPATSAPADPTTRTTETSSPVNKTTEPSTTVPVTSAPAATAPATTQSAISEPSVSESAEPTAPTETTRAPQQPQDVYVGRWFTVTGPDGAELGTAKVEDIVRTPGCGVRLTLHLTTSDETGPARWASIRPSDFIEVRPGGTTRDARRLSSDCEQATHSRSTALSPGRDYEIVIAFQLSDTVSRAMLRPEGTAGWIFDLPPLPKVETTSPSAAPAASAPETTVQTAEA